MAPNDLIFLKTTCQNLCQPCILMLSFCLFFFCLGHFAIQQAFLDTAKFVILRGYIRCKAALWHNNRKLHQVLNMHAAYVENVFLGIFVIQRRSFVHSQRPVAIVGAGGIGDFVLAHRRLECTREGSLTHLYTS